jgi:hypothetical protein
MNDVGRPRHVRANLHAFRRGRDEGHVVVRRARQDQIAAGPEPELGGERRSRVAGHL